jgi:hypothetical protein
MPLAIIGLVDPEARVKFKNIDFQTEADFACYCIAFSFKHIYAQYERTRATQVWQ